MSRVSVTTTPRDAGLSHRDAGSSHRDAGSSHRDAGSSHRDAGSSHRDAGSSHRDAGSSHRDAGSSHRDAGSSHRDAGSSHRDAGSSHRDAGLSRRDAGLSHSEASTTDAAGLPEAALRSEPFQAHAVIDDEQLHREADHFLDLRSDRRHQRARPPVDDVAGPFCRYEQMAVRHQLDRAAAHRAGLEAADPRHLVESDAEQNAPASGVFPFFRDVDDRFPRRRSVERHGGPSTGTARQSKDPRGEESPREPRPSDGGSGCGSARRDPTGTADSDTVARLRPGPFSSRRALRLHD
jgi:hypothetical protein